MSIAIADMRVLKRVLSEFCDDNQLAMNDSDALFAASYLLSLAENGSTDADELRRTLRKSMTAGKRTHGRTA